MPRTSNPKGRTAEAVTFSAPIGLHAKIKQAAAKHGMNQSQYIVQAIRARLAREA